LGLKTPLYGPEAHRSQKSAATTFGDTVVSADATGDGSGDNSNPTCSQCSRPAPDRRAREGLGGVLIRARAE
jgi:hypothetical protein